MTVAYLYRLQRSDKHMPEGNIKDEQNHVHVMMNSV
ncbi:MAG: hypothetical protein FD143_3001 [Ignavibacteria bacterium]|nr:MAG: hypothetical protein FD143_3001 [Ignavibacteria bacterium]